MAFYDATISRLRDFLQDSPLVIELKSRYSNLETQQQQWILFGSIATFLFLVLVLPTSLLITTASMESRIKQMDADSDFLNQTADEISVLNTLVAQQGQAVDPSITPETPIKELSIKYLTSSGITEEAYTVQEAADTKSATLSLSRLNLVQFRKLLYSLENSPAGLELSKVDVEMKPEAKGYMTSAISFSKRDSDKPPEKAPKKSFTR
jgi:hypothetical protein